MRCRGTLDSEQTLQLYRRFMEVVETNERSRKTGAKQTSTVSSFPSSSSSSYTAPSSELLKNGTQRESLLSPMPTSSDRFVTVSPLTGTRLQPTNYEATNGAVWGPGQRESLLTSFEDSSTVSPLTGRRLTSRSAREDVTSPGRVGKYSSSPLTGTRLATNYQETNGAVLGSGERESLLSSRLTSSDGSSTVSPLTGRRLASRSATEDVASPSRVRKYQSLTSSPLTGTQLQPTNYQETNGTVSGSVERDPLLSSRPSSSDRSMTVSPLTGTLLPTNYEAKNTDMPGVGQRESYLSSKPISSESSLTVCPLTGRRLASRSATEDVASPSRVGKYPSSPSYNNALTTESSYIRGALSSPSYSSRLTPLTTTNQVSPFSSRFDGVSGSFATRVGGGGVTGYGQRSPDVAPTPSSLYVQARSRLDDADSPASRLQSLRDSYCSTMWNDSVSPRGGGGDVETPSAAGRLSSYVDADPTTIELLSGPPAGSSRYNRVMSARSRSGTRRGDVLTRDGATEGPVATTRSRITSPVAATRTAINDLSDVLQSSSAAVEHPAAARSAVTVSSRAERMKMYGIGTTTSRTELPRDQTAASSTASLTSSSSVSPPLRSTTTDKLGTSLHKTTTLPSTEHDRTSSTRTVSDIGRLNTSSLIDGTELNPAAEISQMPDVDKSHTEQNAVVLPTTISPKTVRTVNGGKKSPEVRENRLHSATSSVPTGRDKITEKDKVAESTKTTASATKSVTTSGSKSSERDRPRKTDAYDIAGSLLTAETLNRLQAAAAAAADAVVLAATTTMESVGTDSTQGTSPGNVRETSSSSSKHRTTTENRSVVRDGRDNVDESQSASPTRNRTRARAPTTLQQMLIPSDDQKLDKSPAVASKTSDAAASRQLNAAPSSPVSSKAAKAVNSASKPTSAAKGDGGVKSRSKTVVNVNEMLVPTSSATSSNSDAGGSTDRQTANVTSTSSSSTATPTSRTRTSSTSSATGEKKPPEHVRPAKPGSQPPLRRQDAATSRGSVSAVCHRPISLQQTHTTPASKVIQSVDEKKMAAHRTLTKPTSAAGGKTATTTADAEDDWKTTLTDIIQASSDDQHGIQPSGSISSLVSEPAARTRHRSGDGLSSLMRPTASSMARRGSAGDTVTRASSGGRPSYAAPTSSSTSKVMSAAGVMSRTTSSPALPGGAGRMSLPSPSRAGSSSGRTTPTGARRTGADTAQHARPPRTTGSTPAATATRPTRPGTASTTTPGRTNTVQRAAVAALSAGRPTSASSRSRHNSNSSTGSGGDRFTSR